MENPSATGFADGPCEWALRDSNPRPHGCAAESTPFDPQSNSRLMETADSACTAACTGDAENRNAGNVEALAAALFSLSAAERARLAELLTADQRTQVERD